MAALCIGLDGWLLGGFIFDGPTATSLSTAFFVPGFTWLLTPSFIVPHCGFSVDDHSCRHQPRTQADRQVESYLGFIYRQLVPLHALGQVGLSDCVFHQHQELALGFFRPAALAKNTASHVDLHAQDAMHERFD